MVRVDILGIQGNTKGLIFEGRLDQGIHKLDYSLFTVNGNIPAGVYVVRIFLDGSQKGQGRLIIQP
jgi:hypothetical protein